MSKWDFIALQCDICDGITEHLKMEQGTDYWCFTCGLVYVGEVSEV